MFYTKKILTANDLKLVRGSDGNTFKKRLSYQIKTNKFFKIRKGLYILKDQLYQLEESDYRVISNSIYIPSYISFETVLRDHGVIFQFYYSIFVASNYNKSLIIPLNPNLEPIKIQFYKLPKSLLANPLGIQSKDGYNIATLERALCDTYFKWGRFEFDYINSNTINLSKLIQIADLYDLYKPGFKKNLFINLLKYGIRATLPT